MDIEKFNFCFDSEIKHFSETTLNLLSAFSPDSYILLLDTNKRVILYNTLFKDFCVDVFSETLKINEPFPKKILGFFGIENDIGKAYSGKTLTIEKGIDLGRRKMVLQIILYPLKIEKQNTQLAVKITTISQGVKKAYTWHSMLRLSETISHFSTLEELFPEIYKIIVKTFWVKNFYIVSYNKQTKDYYFLFFKDELMHQSYIPSSFLENSLIAKAIKSFKPLLMLGKDIRELFAHNKISLIGQAAKSWMGIPFRINSKNYGGIVVQSYSADYIFDHQDFDLLQIMSQHIGMAIGNKISQLNLLQIHERNDFKLKVAQIFQWEYLVAENEISIDLGINNLKSEESELVKFSLLNFLRFFIAKDAHYFSSELQNLVDNRKQKVDMELQLKPNSQLNSQYTRFSASRFYNRFLKKNTIIGIFQDITELKINELKLESARTKAEESDKLKSSFLANMSHEIRTPLNGILGFSRLLSKPNISDLKRKYYINYIEQSGQNLLHLINDILDISKIESGKFDIRITDCKLNTLMDELYFIFNQQIESSQKIDISLKLEKGVKKDDFIIKIDPLRLRQIFNNLIGNALKFTSQGYIKYGYSFDEQNKEINFFVEDTGIGIPESKKELVFSRFGKIENGRVINPGGSGLGLSIVKQIITGFKGHIDVVSHENKGTRFNFSIPYIKGEIPKFQSKKTEKLEKLSKEVNVKLLLVEDNEINQYLVLETLNGYSSNLKIEMANNGKEAIKKLRESNYDIILMDIQMPIMNGYQATKYIRNKMTAPIKNIPIIGLSAHALKKESEKCLSLGMNSYLTKPFKPEEVLSEIAKLLSVKIVKKTNQADTHNNQISEKKMETLKLDTLKEMYGNDIESLKSVLKLYQEQIPKQIRNLEKSLAHTDWENVQIISHSVKGTLSYLGNDNLYQFALNLENNAKREHNVGQAIHDFSSLKKIWGLIFAEITEMIQ